MTRNFCDRCGVECKSVIVIKIPYKNNGKGSFSTKEIEVCEKCKKIHESLMETLTDIRFSLYKNVFGMKGADDERRKAD